MDTPSLTTELEAVNVILSIIGEAPVNTLVAPYTQDVANARRMITEALKDVLAEGWKFNEETDYTLSVDGNGEIPVPENCLSVDADTDAAVDVVFRSGKLYDLKTHSFQFDHDVHCEVVFYFPFDEIPECARRYVMIKAARREQARFVGSDTQHQFTQMDETRARVVLQNEQGQTADINILNDPALRYMTRRDHPRRFSWL
jgi:hypothetical protein